MTDWLFNKNQVSEVQWRNWLKVCTFKKPFNKNASSKSKPKQNFKNKNRQEKTVKNDNVPKKSTPHNKKNKPNSKNKPFKKNEKVIDKAPKKLVIQEVKKEPKKIKEIPTRASNDPRYKNE